MWRTTAPPCRPVAPVTSAVVVIRAGYCAAALRPRSGARSRALAVLLARVLRGYASAALEDVALWHERDISHSSVERVIGPDATVTLDFMLHRFAGLIDGLRVYPERMLENLELTRGLVFSQPVLLRLIARGMERQAAYVVVQRNAMRVWDEGRDFKALLAEDPEVKKLLTPAELEAAFDLKHELRHVDAIFDRAVGRG